MPIKVLWLCEANMMESQAHIIDHLQRNGCEVVIEMIHRDTLGWAKLTGEALDVHVAEKYDFHVIITHNGNPHVIAFQKYVRPAIGTFDIEHDLFHEYPENSPPDICLGTFAFTRKHETSLRRMKRRVVRCRWYKMDGMRFTTQTWNKVKPSFHFAPGADAIVIGSELWQWPEFIWWRHFHTCWYKPFSTEDKELPRTTRLPDEFCNTQAVSELSNIGRFWFAYESSCLVEALLYGCMPILCNERIIESSPVDDVIDRVKIIARDVGNGGELVSMLAVTQKHFDRKIKLLYDPDVFAATHARLYSEYFEPDEHDLKPVHEALLDEIQKWWRSRHADHH